MGAAEKEADGTHVKALSLLAAFCVPSRPPQPQSFIAADPTLIVLLPTGSPVDRKSRSIKASVAYQERTEKWLDMPASDVGV